MAVRYDPINYDLIRAGRYRDRSVRGGWLIPVKLLALLSGGMVVREAPSSIRSEHHQGAVVATAPAVWLGRNLKGEDVKCNYIFWLSGTTVSPKVGDIWNGIIGGPTGMMERPGNIQFNQSTLAEQRAWDSARGNDLNLISPSPIPKEYWDKANLEVAY